jgi:acyl-[acyl-carrier-protein]-phospholipid O-acyltransferase/long-chain-fatty-acid--[acyl-carrier-protein] ligase
MAPPEPAALPRNAPAEPDMRSFRALVPTVLQANFNDNAFRMVAWIALGAVAAAHGESKDIARTWTGVCLAAPYVFLSLLAGQLADRCSKRAVLVWGKAAELFVLFGGAAALMAGAPSWAMFVILALLGTRFCLIGPSTYGMIAELMPARRLSWANSWVEGMTFVGAIAGTAVGGLLVDLFRSPEGIPRAEAALLVLGGISLLGFLASLRVDRLPPQAPGRRLHLLPLADLRANLAEIRATPGLFWAVAGVMAWWLLAALAMQTAMKLAEDTLLLGGFGTSRLFIYLGLGVGMGSLVAGRLSANRIDLGLVPLGGFLMGLASIAVAVLPETEWATGTALALSGFFAGWFIVPLKAFVQHRASPERRGGILGVVNFVQYSAVFLAVGPTYWLLAEVLRLSGATMFLLLGLAMLGVAGFSLRLLPDAGLRLVLFLFAHTVYRLRIVGRQHVPDSGGALLVANHMSYADGVLLIASLDRPIRPIMFEDIYRKPLVQPFARMARAIPVSGSMEPRELIASLRRAGEFVREGHLVLIFAEGQITRTGQLLPFRKGLEFVMKDVDAPIIPVCLDRVWGSILSFSSDRWMRKLPRRIPWPVTVTFGEPLPAATPAREVRKVVQRLATEAWVHRKEDARLLHREVFRAARRHPFEPFASDALRPLPMRRGVFAAGVVAMARLLAPRLDSSRQVAVCLPPSIAGALVNHALLLLGRVPVNLNYTVSRDILQNILDQCEIGTVITSRAFLEKAGLDLPGEHLLAEDLARAANGWLRATSLVAAMAMPLPWLERLLGAPAGRTVDELATIIFSSGSTGDPKGVMLSHWNISSNIESSGQVFALSKDDTLLGILPFFHSFGAMGTLFLPHVLRTQVAYWPNPLDARAIGEVVHRRQVTVLIATPTFLQSFTRRIEPEQFGSLQVVMTGAEKLRESVAAAFEERFGVRPHEAYGCTECSPAVTMNTRDFRAPGFFQRGSKSGSIGHPLPGVSVRIVDPETGDELPDGRDGLLLVRGPNVMLGYWKRPDLTAAALREGWYVTGDIARIDEDGFVEITDRLARFSKIGGEMVPHGRVEEALTRAAGCSEAAFAVTSVEDERKGERLVVLHTLAVEEAERARERVAASGELPNLWVPRAADFFAIEAIPILGTGKVDLRAVRELARARAQVAQ